MRAAISSFLDALGSADIHEVDLLIGAVEDVGSGTKCRLHDTAGSAEDLTCAGSDSEGIVKLFALEIFEHNTCALDHMATSTSGIPWLESSGLVTSNFLAVQGITLTTYRSLGLMWFF